MWERIKKLWVRIGASLQQILGFKPHTPRTPPNIQRSDFEKNSQSVSKTQVKSLALPISNKYESIDWENSPPKYKKRKGVLTFRERQFYRLLVELRGKENHVLSMVRMADVMWLSNETEDRKFHNNNILCKHFDFVLCDKLRFEPLLVIELDDPKHLYVHRKVDDEFKDKACLEAGLPLLRFKVKENYNKAEIPEIIDEKLSKAF